MTDTSVEGMLMEGSASGIHSVKWTSLGTGLPFIKISIWNIYLWTKVDSSIPFLLFMSPLVVNVIFFLFNFYNNI